MTEQEQELMLIQTFNQLTLIENYLDSIRSLLKDCQADVYTLGKEVHTEIPDII